MSDVMDSSDLFPEDRVMTGTVRVYFRPGIRFPLFLPVKVNCPLSLYIIKMSIAIYGSRPLFSEVTL